MWFSQQYYLNDAVHSNDVTMSVYSKLTCLPHFLAFTYYNYFLNDHTNYNYYTAVAIVINFLAMIIIMHASINTILSSFTVLW